MKKSLAIVVVTLMLSVLVGGCSTKLEETNALLYKKGLKLIEKMDRKAENEEYIKLMDDSAELQVTISKIGEGNYNSPKGIYKVSFPKGLTSSITWRQRVC
ncbi:hypothetical protein PV797_00950 [Clostridiaceae bacterium M8S5]|nr:hypothetical protein PV797_00950 [Clostridiaceae bacterium M8S5]